DVIVDGAVDHGHQTTISDAAALQTCVVADGAVGHLGRALAVDAAAATASDSESTLSVWSIPPRAVLTVSTAGVDRSSNSVNRGTNRRMVRVGLNRSRSQDERRLLMGIPRASGRSARTGGATRTPLAREGAGVSRNGRDTAMKKEERIRTERSANWARQM